MKGIVQLLDVGDGDAIIVSLQKGDKNLVMVVDAGEPQCYYQKVRPALQAVLQAMGKAGPDIVVATHYDSDHIGGLIPLVEEYIAHIEEVWVHRSPELQHEARLLAESAIGNHIRSFSEFDFDKRLANAPGIVTEALEFKKGFVLESLRQLDTFLGKLPVEKVRHVYHGDHPDGWPEVKVLGPTEPFYKSLFPDNKSLVSLVLEEAEEYAQVEKPEFLKRFFTLTDYPKSDCERLKSEGETKLTPTNKASIIIAIDTEKGRSLLTGDAGISSFRAVPDWENELKNLYWLKIPHHGSDNNISREVINVMQPEFADNSGSRHQDDHVLGCIGSNIRSKRAPRSTKSGGDLKMEI